MTTGYFYFQDSLGNTSHVTDAVGNLLERYTYSAFGTPTFYNAAGALIGVTPGTPTGASALGIKHLFQGQLWTQDTGLNDYRNRVEFPTMGVFLQPDPIGFKGDAANIYRFCGNDPVDRTDPMGMVAEKAFGPLISFDGGDWVRGSDGLTASDWDHKHDQAGMDNGGGGGGASAGNGSGKSISPENEGSKSYTYSLKSQYNIGDLSGARGYEYVSDPNKNVDGQCLAGVQYLSGTPSSRTPLQRGAAVGPHTARGTAIATGFVQDKNGRWIYPSKPANESPNHAAFYVAPLGKGNMQILSQSHGKAFTLESRPTNGWNVITSKAPPEGTSSSHLRSTPNPLLPWY